MAMLFAKLSLLTIALSVLVVALGAKVFFVMPGLFWGHIVAMLTCWSVVASASVIITLNSNLDVDGSTDTTRKKARIMHGAMMSVAVIAALIGYWCIFKNHALMGQSQFGLDPGNPPARTAHAMFGYLLIFCLLLQASQGIAKFIKLEGVQNSFLAKFGSYVPDHAFRGKLLLPLMALNAAVILTVMPGMSSYEFVALEGGLLGSSALSSWLAGKRPVRAREPHEEGDYVRLQGVGGGELATALM
mmetsp:Transcript_42358/g.76880  ORF Transcript_42358/g.76880 Transcript_42358/m.76880 type:complete len:245 (+) Transcript_42358:131-865(+)